MDDSLDSTMPVEHFPEQWEASPSKILTNEPQESVYFHNNHYPNDGDDLNNESTRDDVSKLASDNDGPERIYVPDQLNDESTLINNLHNDTSDLFAAMTINSTKRLSVREESFASSDADDEMDDNVGVSDYEWTEDERVDYVPVTNTIVSDSGMSSVESDSDYNGRKKQPQPQLSTNISGRLDTGDRHRRRPPMTPEEENYAEGYHPDQSDLDALSNVTPIHENYVPSTQERSLEMINDYVETIDSPPLECVLDSNLETMEKERDHSYVSNEELPLNVVPHGEEKLETSDCVQTEQNHNQSGPESADILFSINSTNERNTVQSGSGKEAHEGETSAVAEPNEPSRAITLFDNSKKFVFLSDEKAIPKQLTKLQEQSLRQKHEFQTAMHNLECKIAALTARLANESMDTDIELKSVKDESIFKPLEQAYARLSLDRSRSCIASTQWINLEKRMSSLDAQMTHSVFVSFHDAKKNCIDSLRDELSNDVKVDMKIESVQACKRENVLFRKFDDMVGSMSRRYQEERATRLAEVEILTDSVTSGVNAFDLSAYEQILNKIQKIRQQFVEEREERIRQDKIMMEQVNVKYDMMKNSILEAFGDPHWD